MSHTTFSQDCDPQDSPSCEEQYYAEHSRDLTVEEYFANIDQRVNLKVAQGIKQAMSLVLAKIDLLIDNKVAAKAHAEAGKVIAVE